MPIDAGTQVGRFRVIRLLAQGGMAEVYRAEQELATGIFRPAALKVIRPEYAESEDFREMFLDEARTACTLSHPNIVHIYEVGESDGLLFMGMELVSGESIMAVARALEERGQHFDDDALISLGVGTCSALEAVHALKVSGPDTPAEHAVNLVHRDVSPQNLLLSPNGALRLIDFGIAKAATNRNLTMPGMTKGKAGYFSPEQAIGQPLDGRSDLFSLGVTLYRLAAGINPFDEYKSHQERQTALVTGRWRPVHEAAPARLPGLHRIITKAMQLKAEDRYQNALEMREDLETVAFEAGVQVGQAPLAGYVADHDGEISIPDARKVSGPHMLRRRTLDQMPAAVSPPPPPPPRTLRRGVAAALWATVIAGGATMLILQPKGTPAEDQPTVEVTAEEPTIEAAAPDVAAPDAAVAAAEVEAPKPVLGAPEVVAARAPAPVGPPRSRASANPVSVAASPRAARPAPEPRKPPAEEEVFTGEGKLRVGSFVGTSQVGSLVAVVGGEKMGEAPLSTSMKSGRYTLEFRNAELDKHGKCVGVTVRDGQTTMVKYDFDTQKCSIK